MSVENDIGLSPVKHTFDAAVSGVTSDRIAVNRMLGGRTRERLPTYFSQVSQKGVEFSHSA